MAMGEFDWTLKNCSLYTRSDLFTLGKKYSSSTVQGIPGDLRSSLQFTIQLPVGKIHIRRSIPAFAV